VSESAFELVRVSRQMVDRLLAGDSAPVILIALERQEDGTCDMTFKRPDLAPNNANREAIIATAAAELKAEVEHRNEWYGLDNWTFEEVAKFVLDAAFRDTYDALTAHETAHGGPDDQ
jgi:hypothetical protein